MRIMIGYGRVYITELLQVYILKIDIQFRKETVSKQLKEVIKKFIRKLIISVTVLNEMKNYNKQTKPGQLKIKT